MAIVSLGETIATLIDWSGGGAGSPCAGAGPDEASAGAELRGGDAQATTASTASPNPAVPHSRIAPSRPTGPLSRPSCGRLGARTISRGAGAANRVAHPVAGPDRPPDSATHSAANGS